MKMKIYMVVILAISLLLVTPSLANAKYNDSVSDSTGDVWYYQYTETKFQWKEGVERPDIDITEVKISESGDMISVSLKVKGTISEEGEVVYEISLEDENEDSYTILWTGGQGFIEGPNTDMMLQVTGIGTSTLETSFSLSDINNPDSLEIAEAYTYDWIDAEGEGEYYQDVAGPEATSPSGSSNGDGNGGSSGEISDDILDKLWAGSMLCIALTIIVPLIIIILIVFLILKVIRGGEDKGQQPQQYQQQQSREYQQPPPEEKQEKTPPPPEDQGGSKDTPPPPEEQDDSKDLPPPPEED